MKKIEKMRGVANSFHFHSLDHPPLNLSSILPSSLPSSLPFPPPLPSLLLPLSPRQVAKIHYVVGEPLVALSYQHKAVLVYERVLGVDHPETVTSYINLAIYCHNTNQTTVALRLMFRARYLLLLMCGEDHPEVATCDCNIALMLHSIKLYDSSLQFLENSLRVFEK